MARADGLYTKKEHGQHFLRAQWVIDEICSLVTLDTGTNVFEIGCGDGVLTSAVLSHPIERLWVFEIDPAWAAYTQKRCDDERLEVHQENILDSDLTRMREHGMWTVTANLPYHITFPILHLLYAHRDILSEGCIMVQEEVAQKICATRGRSFGYPALFFQRYFAWTLGSLIPPDAFYPKPKVRSRLLHFVPRSPQEIPEIPNEVKFWKFIRVCFQQPRRTLRNNLKAAQYSLEHIDEELLNLRAQQVTMETFVYLWSIVRRR